MDMTFSSNVGLMEMAFVRVTLSLVFNVIVSVSFTLFVLQFWHMYIICLKSVFAFDQISAPSSSRIISIMSLTTGQEVLSIDTSTEATVSSDGRSLLIQLPSTLSSTDTFLANIARGAFETNDFCGVENEPQVAPVMFAGPPPTGKRKTSRWRIVSNKMNVNIVCLYVWGDTCTIGTDLVNSGEFTCTLCLFPVENNKREEAPMVR